MTRRRGFRRIAAWLRSVGFTIGLLLLVAWGVGDQGRGLQAAVLAVAVFGLGLLYYLFPRGVHFAFGAATGLALYASLFVVLGSAQFPDAPDWSRPVAFLLPVVAFLGVVWWRRARLIRVVEQQAAAALDHIGHSARWLALVAAVGVVSFALPINRMAPDWQAGALLAAMAAVAATVALAARDVLRLLVDVSLIIDEIAGRMRNVAVPATAFLLLYVLLVIVFAAAYRVADGLSEHPLFHEGSDAARMTYAAALHFSVATLSTVGYGDIQPRDDGIRVLASIQVVAGQLLLLFGVAEILRSRRAKTHAGNDAKTHAEADAKTHAEGDVKRAGRHAQGRAPLDGGDESGVSRDVPEGQGHAGAGPSPRGRRNPPSSSRPNE